jgi:hypothetical protein
MCPCPWSISSAWKEQTHEKIKKFCCKKVRAPPPGRYVLSQWELDMHVDGRAKFLSK